MLFLYTARMRPTVLTDAMRRAIAFSIEVHELDGRQKRKGKDVPYITHPLIVGTILARVGAREAVVIAGILHDTVEDSIPEKKVTPEMLAERFGDEVARLVMDVTEKDKSLPWEDRKIAARADIQDFSHDALLVKSADVISNVSELADDYDSDGAQVLDRFDVSGDRVAGNYLNVIRTLLARWPENPLAGDLHVLADRLSGLSR